uniref:Uncharacterized protein n=1 Tax=Amphimedon queenslandica TaxID=400682 RepID=A0A1X7U2A1_AMPQE
MDSRELGQSKHIGILTNESTDTGTTNNRIIYVLSVTLDATVTTEYLKLVALSEGGKAEAFTLKINVALKGFNVDLQKCVGFASNGAQVMVDGGPPPPVDGDGGSPPPPPGGLLPPPALLVAGGQPSPVAGDRGPPRGPLPLLALPAAGGLPPPVAGDRGPPPPPPALPRAGGPPPPVDRGTPVLPPGVAPMLPPGGAPPASGLPLLQQKRQHIIAQLRAVNRQIYANLTRRAGRGGGRGRRPRSRQASVKNYNFY